MTSSLLLQLKGPMQSWGESSRYSERSTDQMPTKSGVIGLLAAAAGRRRTDPIEDLAQLIFAVRIDQPGSLLRDYQTAERWQTNGGTKLVTRYYLEDAVFIAAVQSDDDGLIESLKNALNSPRFPLFLGRRNCPASPDLVLGIEHSDAITALRHTKWRASKTHRIKRASQVELPIYRDALPGENGFARRDVPVSFAQEHRKYTWRKVVKEAQGAVFENPDGNNVDPFMEAVTSA